VEEFKYLGRIVTREDNDKVAVKWNLARAKKKWASMRTISDHRWSRFENNCNFLSNSGNVRATVWKRNMSADERYDMAASQFSQEVLSRNNRRIYSSGGIWTRMGLPRQQ
jgi:hypothetical protein